MKQVKGVAVRDSEWGKAEYAVSSWLRSQGFTVEKGRYRDPFDLLVNGNPVEVKAASLQTTPHGLCWYFNIHRHNKLAEDGLVAYILRCDPGVASSLLGKAAIHLIIPAPIGTKSFKVSVRSLLTRDAKYFNNFAALEKRNA